MARSPSTFRQNDVTRALKKTVRRRKPTLRGALEAAQKAGRPVRSATIEDGKVTLVFGEPTADTSNEWDEALNRGKR
jgi:hypothetical protein